MTDTPSGATQVAVPFGPPEAWAVLVDCPTPGNAQKAVDQILAAKLDSMADRLDATSARLLGRFVNEDQDHGVRAAAAFLRTESAVLRGEC